jgi:hypothetical protein
MLDGTIDRPSGEIGLSPSPEDVSLQTLANEKRQQRSNQIIKRVENPLAVAAGQVAFPSKILDDFGRIKRQPNVASWRGPRLGEDIRKRLVWSFGAPHSVGLAKTNCLTEPKKSFVSSDSAR